MSRRKKSETTVRRDFSNKKVRELLNKGQLPMLTEAEYIRLPQSLKDKVERKTKEALKIARKKLEKSK